ncbi:NepR family anti-sigma factor [Marivita sp.]|uniref:NepR family anti-sigma factor n=1 Tax=Marivita sp. TaxID=2003365 RepID=UPI0025BEBE15|nr:NepR family anti-sigma factor [Marivita sp.]
MTQDRRNSNLEEAIEANLKRVYEDVANQDVPDRFKDLLNKLRESEQTEKTEPENNDG